MARVASSAEHSPPVSREQSRSEVLGETEDEANPCPGAQKTSAPGREQAVGWGGGTSSRKGDIAVVPWLQVSGLKKKGRAPEWVGRALLGRAAAASFGRRPGYR